MALSNRVITTGGISIGIAVGQPADYTEVDFLELPYVYIGQIIDAGSSGRTYNTVSYSPLDHRETIKLKGHFDEGSRTISLGRDTVDPGQANILRDINSDYLFSFRMIYQNGHINYFTARVISYTDDDGASDSIVGSTVSLSLGGSTIRNAAPLRTLLHSSVSTDANPDRYKLGDSITTTFTVTEGIGEVTLQTVTLFGLVAGEEGANLVSGTSSTYAAVHVITQDDLNATADLFPIDIEFTANSEVKNFAHTTDGSFLSP